MNQEVVEHVQDSEPLQVENPRLGCLSFLENQLEDVKMTVHLRKCCMSNWTLSVHRHVLPLLSSFSKAFVFQLELEVFPGNFVSSVGVKGECNTLD